MKRHPPRRNSTTWQQFSARALRAVPKGSPRSQHARALKIAGELWREGRRSDAGLAVTAALFPGPVKVVDRRHQRAARPRPHG